MRKSDISRLGEELLKQRGFRFRIGQEVFRNLQQAKLKSKFLNLIDKKLISLIGWIRLLDKKL